MQLGSRESYEDWLDFGRDLIARGMRSPALLVADGAPGLWKAARELWPAALEQRCTVHALRNITKKLPERLHRELKARYWRILDEASSVVEARAGLLSLAADYRAAYPSAASVIERDVDAFVCHLRFPSLHRKRIRSTNLLERTFVEVRRRTKVIGRFPGETSALSLIWAVLELSSRGWRGVVMTPQAVAEIERLRRGQTGEPDQAPATEEVIAAQDRVQAELRPNDFTRTLGRHQPDRGRPEAIGPSFRRGDACVAPRGDRQPHQGEVTAPLPLGGEQLVVRR